MPASTALLNALGTQIDVLVQFVGLVDEAGVELTGGSPAYARVAVAWTGPVNGLIRPTVDLVFNVPTGVTVSEWRGYSALSAGTDYGGGDLPNQPFFSQGQYTLLAASTAYDVNVG